MTRFAMEYAKALFELASEENIAEEIGSQLKCVSGIFAENPDYPKLLSLKSIDAQERRAMLTEAFHDMHPYLINFLKILIDRNAVYSFSECAQAYRELYNAAFHVTQASVASAAPLSDEQLESLRRKLEELSGGKVELQLRTDPELIGGICVDMNGRRYDNSIRTRMETLRRSLARNEGKEI